jgi:hypothetical protein
VKRRTNKTKDWRNEGKEKTMRPPLRLIGAAVLVAVALPIAALPSAAQNSPGMLIQAGFHGSPGFFLGGFGRHAQLGGRFRLPFGGRRFGLPFGGRRFGLLFGGRRFGFPFDGRRFGLGVGRFRGQFGFGRFGPGDAGFLPYGYYGGYYGLGDGGLDYGYNPGAGAPPEPALAPSEPLAMALPPAPPPVPQGITVETTSMGITIVRGHTQ